MEYLIEEDGIIELGAASTVTLGDFYAGRYEALVIPDYWDMP